ncbi:MAG: hypothetical protein C0403_10600 [Desulfobacterium sp.]|nr:hypothetical protein [Desulfobacterium sp.]
MIAIFLLVFINFTGVVHAQVQTHNVIVDNFEKPGKKNSRDGDFGAFSDPKSLGRCYLFFFQNKEKDIQVTSEYALYIEWDTSKAGAYGGYWTDLKHLNIENHGHLSFYVKGLKGGEKFKVGLRGSVNSTYEKKILINRVLKNGVTTEWQKVNIPLKWFGAIDDWGDVNMLSINFENAFDSGKGAILIDEITFEK